MTFDERKTIFDFLFFYLTFFLLLCNVCFYCLFVHATIMIAIIIIIIILALKKKGGEFFTIFYQLPWHLSIFIALTKLTPGGIYKKWKRADKGHTHFLSVIKKLNKILAVKRCDKCNDTNWFVLNTVYADCCLLRSLISLIGPITWSRKQKRKL